VVTGVYRTNPLVAASPFIRRYTSGWRWKRRSGAASPACCRTFGRQIPAHPNDRLWPGARL